MSSTHLSTIAVSVASGLLLGALGASMALLPRVTSLERTVEKLEGQLAAVPGSGAPATPQQLGAGSPGPVRLQPAPGEGLSRMIADLQRAYVRESLGEQAGQNFSSDDLEAFREDAVALAITDSLRHDASFLAVVLGLQAEDAARRQELLRSANRPLRPTWFELGRVGPDGQTEAGNQAERLIATSVVRLAEQLIALPPDSIRRLTIP